MGCSSASFSGEKYRAALNASMDTLRSMSNLDLKYEYINDLDLSKNHVKDTRKTNKTVKDASVSALRGLVQP